MERVAVLAFQNLSADPSLDWAGPALSGMLTEQVSASVSVYPFHAADLRAARLGGATRVVEGYYARAGDRFRIYAVVEDLRSLRNVKTVARHATLRGGFNAAVDSIASAIDSRTRPFGTQNAEAIRAWGESLAAGDPRQKIDHLRRAIAADPNFGEAYADLARIYLGTGDAAHAQEVLKQADDRLSQFTDLERARVELLESDVRRNETQRRAALVALSRLISTDVEAMHRLAQAELNARHFSSAVDLLKSAVAVEPDDANLLNELGYAESYRGNLDGARAALERYRAMQSAQPNALDSLGEVHFFRGRFADAEKYFLEAQRMQPGFLNGAELLKAAEARYLDGNRNGADQLYSQFDKLRRGAGDALADVRQAEWLYITERRAEASAAAERSAQNGNPDIAAYALCHLSLWSMDAGHRVEAADFAARALRSARGASANALATLCGYVAGGAGEDGKPVPDLARAYIHLFAHQPQQAAALLKPVYERSSPASDGEIRTLYAWALSEAGRRDDARPLLESYPIPMGASDEPIFMTHAFPHFLALRSAIFGSTGNTPARR